MKPGSPSRPATSGAPRIAVVGGGAADDEALALAESVGRRLGTAGAVLICGGRSGVMAAAARGCREAGGLTLGILPGEDAAASPPNEWIDVPVFDRDALDASPLAGPAIVEEPHSTLWLPPAWVMTPGATGDREGTCRHSSRSSRWRAGSTSWS